MAVSDGFQRGRKRSASSFAVTVVGVLFGAMFYFLDLDVDVGFCVDVNVERKDPRRHPQPYATLHYANPKRCMRRHRVLRSMPSSRAASARLPPA